MPRVRKGAARRRSKNRILKAAKGYRGGRSKLYRVAKQAVRRSASYSYEHRKLKKRDFRKLWIVRIGAACKQRGLSYSRFIHGLQKNNVDINRPMLAALAIEEPAAFDRLVELAQSNN